jgi:hypothetical protein
MILVCSSGTVHAPEIGIFERHQRSVSKTRVFGTVQ